MDGFGVVVGGKHDDRYAGLLPHQFEDLKTVEFGENDVENDEVWFLALRLAKAFEAVEGGDNVETFLLERPFRQSHQRPGVVDDQHPRHGPRRDWFDDARPVGGEHRFDVIHDNQTLGWGLLPLQALGVTRTTRDIDLLISGKDCAKVKDMMLARGYELIHESEDVLNFTGENLELGRVDFLLAHRKYTLAMLNRADEQPVFEDRFRIKAVKAEDLIGLKVQSSSNDPGRQNHDMADVRSLLEQRSCGLYRRIESS